MFVTFISVAIVQEIMIMERNNFGKKKFKIWLYKTNNQVISLIVCQILFIMYLEIFFCFTKIKQKTF